MSRYRIIFDDSCPFCRASVERLELLDTLGLVEKIPLSQVHHKIDLALPPHAQLEQSLHLVLPDKTIVAGADAVAILASLFPRSRWLGRVLRLPGIRQLARWGYGLVARHRLQVSRLLVPAKAKHK